MNSLVLGALSDGVIAIVLTLLVPELQIPNEAEVTASAWSVIATLSLH